jgi:hypothetical protein
MKKIELRDMVQHGNLNEAILKTPGAGEIVLVVPGLDEIINPLDSDGWTGYLIAKAREMARLAEHFPSSDHGGWDKLLEQLDKIQNVVK